MINKFWSNVKHCVVGKILWSGKWQPTPVYKADFLSLNK